MKKNMKKIVFLLVLGLCVANFFFVAEAKEKQRRIEKGKEDSPFGYFEYIPRKSANKKLPLIIFWHGLGECGNGTNELDKVLKNGIPRLIEGGKDFDAIVISPQTTPWPKWEDLKTFFEYITEKYKDKIDPDRIYVTGLSMGGRNTVVLARGFPDKIAAMVPICPADDRPGDVSKMVNMGVWFFHNEGDQTVKVSSSETWVKALKDAGGKPQITIYKEKGHNAWSKTYDDKKMWKWLFEQKLQKNGAFDETNKTK